MDDALPWSSRTNIVYGGAADALLVSASALRPAADARGDGVSGQLRGVFDFREVDVDQQLRPPQKDGPAELLGVSKCLIGMAQSLCAVAVTPVAASAGGHFRRAS